MALNREQKRMLRKQGELGPDGEPVRTQARRQPAPKTQGAAHRRAPVRQGGPRRAAQGGLAHQVRDDQLLDHRARHAGRSSPTLIFGIDWVFAEFVLRLFEAR